MSGQALNIEHPMKAQNSVRQVWCEQITRPRFGLRWQAQRDTAFRTSIKPPDTPGHSQSRSPLRSAGAVQIEGGANLSRYDAVEQEATERTESGDVVGEGKFCCSHVSA
jgi:hypothetical protein